MIYELDKRQLLRLWSVLSSFGEIRETKDPIIQSEILRRAQLVLTDFVFGLKRVPERVFVRLNPVPRSDYSSGIPALRRPTKKVVSYRALIFGTPKAGTPLMQGRQTIGATLLLP